MTEGLKEAGFIPVGRGQQCEDCRSRNRSGIKSTFYIRDCILELKLRPPCYCTKRIDLFQDGTCELFNPTVGAFLKEIKNNPQSFVYQLTASICSAYPH